MSSSPFGFPLRPAGVTILQILFCFHKAFYKYCFVSIRLSSVVTKANKVSKALCRR